MVCVERLKRKGKTYYYVSKNFRVGPRKWRKIREYAGEKPPSKEKIKKLVRKSIIARVDISENTKITKEMLIVKRPGIGIAPKYLSKVLNKKAKKGIKKDELISFEKLE